MANNSYVTICPVEDIAEGQREVFDLNGRWVAIFCVSGRYYAIEDVCTHDGQTLTQDRYGNDVPLEGYEIACPRHGARFDIRTGAVLTPPALQNVRRYEVRVHEGQIELLV